MKAAHALLFLVSCVLHLTNGHTLPSIPNSHHKSAVEFSTLGGIKEGVDLIVREGQGSSSNGCFPSLGFQNYTGSKPPSISLSNWWCPFESENGFLGFTYGGDQCQSYDTLVDHFTQMRTQYKARYVRLYSWCTWRDGYYEDVINAAFDVGLGIYSTIWFGFDGDDVWKDRRDLWVNIIKNNPLAPYVIRSLDVGSEPLYDWVLEPEDLAAQVRNVSEILAPFGINVSISEMMYGYTEHDNWQAVLDSVAVVHAHILPFFDANATDGASAWPVIKNSTDWFVSETHGSKKVLFTQTGWPSNNETWQANSPNATASVESSKAYAQLLDTSCETLKALTPQGGVGWFWHIWRDEMLNGWGLLDWDGKAKWDFAPRTEC